MALSWDLVAQGSSDQVSSVHACRVAAEIAVGEFASDAGRRTACARRTELQSLRSLTGEGRAGVLVKGAEGNSSRTTVAAMRPFLGYIHAMPQLLTRYVMAGRGTYLRLWVDRASIISALIFRPTQAR